MKEWRRFISRFAPWPAGIAVAGLILAAGFCPLFSEVTPFWTRFKFPVTFGSLGVENGLSQGSVLAVCQDRRGFMWFGTEDGLNRFDGYDFTIFRPDPANPYSISDNIVSCIYEDTSGRLWIGTQGGGLNQFEPEKERFVAYRYAHHDPFSLNSDSITRIMEDMSGRIWVATDGGGLCLMISGRDGKSREFIRYIHDPDNPRSIGGDIVTSIIQDRNGVIWAGCLDGGLNRLEFGEEGIRSIHFTRYAERLDDPATTGLDRVTSLEEDGEGHIWVGTEDGLIFYEPDSGRFRRFHARSGNSSSLSHNNIRVLFRDRMGVLWVGTDGGGLNKVLWDHAANAEPVFVRYMYDPENPGGIRSNAVESLYEDRGGVLWIGLYYGGLSKIVLRGNVPEQRDREKFVHYRSAPRDWRSLSYNFVNAIVESPQGSIWVGTDGGGLNQALAPNNSDSPLQFIHYRHHPNQKNGLSDDIITALCFDRQKRLWIGTYTGGLNRLVEDGRGRNPSRFIHYLHDPDNPATLSSNFVMSILQDSRGVLWVGVIDGGLNRWNEKEGTWTCWRHDPGNFRSINDDNVNTMLEDRKGRFWVGTAVGLHLLERDKMEFRRYLNNHADPSSISHNYIRTIFEDQLGRIWIGTNGGGLNLLVDDEDSGQYQFRRLRSEDGLPSNVVMGILEDEKGFLWLSTGRGLARLDPAAWKVVNFSSGNGVQADEFNRNAFCRSRSGEMFFGGKNGLYIFMPQEITQNPHVPPLAITGLQLFGRPVGIEEEIRGKAILHQAVSETRRIVLSHRHTVFSLTFAALSYIDPGRNQYAYKMEGLDQHWNRSGSRRYASFTTLPHGDYTFRVKATNNEGLWNEEGISVDITILPPFWKKPLFLTLFTVLALFLGIFLYRLRIHRLTRRHRVLEELVEQRTRELHEASLKDPLTGLRNRRFIDEILLGELDGILSRRIFQIRNECDRRRPLDEGEIGLILIDIDHFKKLNDQFGHSCGDRYLIRLAQLLQSSVRTDDEVIRFGGQEFLIVLKRCDLAFLDAFVLRMKEAVSSLVIGEDGEDIHLTCSIGYASYPFYGLNPGLMSFDRLMLVVDAGLHYAKHHGRNMAVKAVPAEPPPEEAHFSQLIRVMEMEPKNRFFSLLPFR